MKSSVKSQPALLNNPIPLSVTGLHCGYRNHPVLTGVDFSAIPGEILVILGANGAGKSTLLHALAGQVPIQAGEVTYEASSLAHLSPADHAKVVSLMPQFEARDIAVSVHDVVMLGRAPHRGWLSRWHEEDQQIVEDVLRAVGLESLRDRTVGTLSGGEWRRMMLARSLAQQTPILLLDEPTEGLDLRYQYDCLEHVRRVVRERQMIAIVTLHDLNQAAAYGDRIGLLAHKKLIAIAEPRSVLTPELIEETYGIRVDIIPHPHANHPLIIPAVIPQR